MSFPHPLNLASQGECCATRCILSLGLLPFIWPGGYERFLILEDGAVLCRRCAKREAALILASWPGESWRPVTVGSADWLDEPELCSHCGEGIE